MNIIKTINSKRFSLNGIEYLKNYITEVVGNRIEVFNCYDRCDVLLPLTQYNQFTVNGVVHSTVGQLQAALLDVLYSRATLGNVVADIDQDNIDIVRSVRLTSFSIQNVLNAINNGPAFTTGDKQSIWVVVQIYAQLIRTGSIYKYKVMKLGKGDYGLGGAALTSSNLELVYYSKPNVQDLISLPTTHIINFGTLTGQTAIQWLNTQPVNISIQPFETGHTILNGLVNGAQTYYALRTTGGDYGSKGLQATADDLEEINLQVPQPVDGYDSVLSQNNETENFAIHKDDQSEALTAYGHIIKHVGNEGNETTISFDAPTANVAYRIPAKPTDDTFAMKSDIKEDLPADLIISCTYDQINRCNFPIYLTDSWHRLSIQEYVGVSVYATYSVVINGNDIIFSIQETNDMGENGILVLKDCYLYNNKIYIGSHDYKVLNEVHKDINNKPYLLYEIILGEKGDYIYLVTKQTISGNFDNSNTQFFKINTHNLNDFKVYELPQSGNFQGYTTHITLYEGYLYFLMGTFGIGAVWLCRIDENLKAPESLFQTGTITTERVANDCPFEIYRGEAYIPTIWNTTNGMNSIGLQVWDLARKTISRKVQQVTISTDATTTPAPNWINIYNGKVIFHTASGGGGNMKLIRFDALTLALEEVVSLSSKHTNDGSFDNSGWLYIHPIAVGVQGYRYRYDNFTISEQIVLPEGTPYYYSVGSPRYYPQKKLLKTNLSQFNNDLSMVKTINGISADSVGNFVIATAANTPLVIASKAGLSASVTGSVDGTTEKILASVLVPANTLGKGMLTFDATFTASATGINAVKTMRLRTGTANTISGATIIATAQATATARYTPFARRDIYLTGTTIRSFGAIGVAETGSTTAIINAAFNPAVANYFLITASLANAADDITLENFALTFIKEI